MQKQKTKQVNRLTISFTKSDDDLMEFVEDLKLENKASEFIRDAIREKMNRSLLEQSNSEKIMNELECIAKKISSMGNKYISPAEDESFLVSKEDRFIVSRQDRFSSTEIEEEIPEEKVEKKEDDLGGALEFFGF